MIYAGHIEEQSMSSEVGAAELWVVAMCRASDLAASQEMVACSSGLLRIQIMSFNLFTSCQW